MGRIRSVKPELARCLPLAQVDPAARYTFVMLTCCVDDEGRAVDDARLIKADIYPYDDIPAAEVDEHLAALAKDETLLCRYTVAGQKFLHIPGFRDDRCQPELRPPWGQKPQKPQPSRYPPCERDHSPTGQGALFDLSGSGSGTVGEHSSTAMGKSLPQGPKTKDQRPKTRAQGPVARGQGPAVRENSHTAAPPDAFDQFWAAYPRREGKRAAAAALERALKRARFEVILAGAQRYRADPNRVDRYTKHATTWLNQDCWEDPPLPPRFGSGHSRTDEHVMAGIGLTERLRAEEEAGHAG